MNIDKGFEAEQGSYSLASIYSRPTENVTKVEDYNLEHLNYDKLVQSGDDKLISKERFHHNELPQRHYEKQTSFKKGKFNRSNNVKYNKNDDLNSLNMEHYDKDRHKIENESKGKSRRRKEKYYGKRRSLYREVSPKTQRRLSEADLMNGKGLMKYNEEIGKKFHGKKFSKSKHGEDDISETISSIGSQDEFVSDGGQNKEGTISEFEEIFKSLKKENKRKTKKHKENSLVQGESTTTSLNNFTHDEQNNDTRDEANSEITKELYNKSKLEHTITSPEKIIKIGSNNILSIDTGIYDKEYDKVMDKESFELVKKFVEENEENKNSNSYLDEYYDEPLPHHVIGKQEYCPKSTNENQPKQLEPGFGLWKANRTPIRRENNLLDKQNRPKRKSEEVSNEQSKYAIRPQKSGSLQNNKSETQLSTDSNNNANTSNTAENPPKKFNYNNFRSYLKEELEKIQKGLPYRDDTSTQMKNKSNEQHHLQIKDKLSESKVKPGKQNRSFITHNTTNKFKNKISKPSTNEGFQRVASNKGYSDREYDKMISKDKNNFLKPKTYKDLEGKTLNKNKPEYKASSDTQGFSVMSQNKNDMSNYKFQNLTHNDLREVNLNKENLNYKPTYIRQDSRNMPHSQNDKLKVPPTNIGLKGTNLYGNKNKESVYKPQDNAHNNDSAEPKGREPYYKQFYNKNKKQDKILRQLGNPKLVIVGREKWDDKLKNSTIKDSKRNLRIVTHVTYTQTQSNACENENDCIEVVRNLHKWNLESGKPDIHYNFLVGGDAAIYEGSGWPKTTTTYEPSGFDILYKGLPPSSGTSSINIGFIGHYKDERPPPHMLNAAYVFVNYGMDQKYINRNFTHTRLV